MPFSVSGQLLSYVKMGKAIMQVIIDGQLLSVEQARLVLFSPPKPEVPKKRDITTTKEYKQFRLEVLSRDEFTCVSCEQVGGLLEVHHLKKKVKYPELACDVDNGITLCYECHTKVHNRRWDYIYKNR